MTMEVSAHPLLNYVSDRSGPRVPVAADVRRQVRVVQAPIHGPCLLPTQRIESSEKKLR